MHKSQYVTAFPLLYVQKNNDCIHKNTIVQNLSLSASNFSSIGPWTRPLLSDIGGGGGIGPPGILADPPTCRIP